MEQYNSNETVTISLIRYEELRANQRPANAPVYGSEFYDAIDRYMKKNNLLPVYYMPAYEHPACEIVTIEEAVKRGVINEDGSPKLL